MADKERDKTFLATSQPGVISGISIASFLQMLEQECHCCQVRVVSGDDYGVLFFEGGELIDAECDNLTGLEAAYAILSWPEHAMVIGERAERPRRISHGLGFILLDAAKRQDERREERHEEPMNESNISYASEEARKSQELKDAVAALATIKDIRNFYLFNKSGKIVAHSAPSMALGELIIYCIITSSELRKSLDTSNPRRIHMLMKDGSSLLIMPKAGNVLGIIAMVLNANSLLSDVVGRLNSAFATKATK